MFQEVEYTKTANSRQACSMTQGRISPNVVKSSLDTHSKRCTPSYTSRKRRNVFKHQRSFSDISLILVVLLSVIDASIGFQICPHSHARYSRTLLHARSSAVKETIRPVQPLKSSSKEKRQSVQKAWEQAQVLIVDEDGIDDSVSATPFLDLFTDAGIASVKKVSNERKKHQRPKGRPKSVAGAMSRTTLMSLNEIESRPYQKAESGSITKGVIRRPNASKVAVPKRRGRGRPRKVDEVASIDEITSIAATTAMEPQNLEDAKSTNVDDASSNDLKGEDATKGQNKRKSRVKILPKARKMKDSDRDDQTTGMMQPRRRGRKGKEEPPNLQRYYRTQLLTQEEEYTLGMKIQFLIKCEQVHEGLFNEMGRAPTIVEWSKACGFEEEDPIRSMSNYRETDLEKQIRPIKSEAWEEEQDPNMFVGNGLANDTGPGRGRGRAKKPPPTFLKDYYDDSDTKFLDVKPKKKAGPINRGSPEDFVELMLTAKEAKQKMVQCNMRLVVSIAKRYKHVGVNIADLVQEGSIGLTRAAEKFDPKKGFKFSTYASW
jgi:hypothetical protein